MARVRGGDILRGMMKVPAPAPSSTSDPRVGRVLGDRYLLTARIGSGAYADIYRAEDQERGREVAVKVLDPPDVDDRARMETRIRRFEREAQAMRSLFHPNIAQVLDFGVTRGGLQYMVLELLEGETWLEWAREHRPPSLARVADVAAQVCAALEAAHRSGIIHRDIKPENIVLLPDGTAKLLDFGAASLFGPEQEMAADLTASGATIGSAPYMSPEQTRAEDVSPSSDLYSLGVSLYEVLAGELPFQGNFVTLMSQHCFADPPRIELPGVPPALVAEWQRVVDALMAKTPDGRPADASAARQELLGLRELSARLQGEGGRGVAAPASGSQTAGGPSPTHREFGGKSGAEGEGGIPGWVAFAGIALVVALVITLLSL